MTREEAKQLVMTMTVAYPNYHPADTTFTVNVWASMLEEYDFQQIQIAFKKYVLSDTSGFAPSIGQLTEHLLDAAEGDDIGELQAWDMVSRAIGNSGYHSESEFQKLPPAVQRAVGSAANLKEWALMDISVVHSVVQSNVIRNYRAAVKAMRNEAKLPPGFRQLLASQRVIPERLAVSEARLEEGPEEQLDEKAEMSGKARERLEELRRQLGSG